MEFYKLYHRRTNYKKLFEWIDRGFRPERWKIHDELLQDIDNLLKSRLNLTINTLINHL